MNKKVNDLVRLQKAMQKKLKTASYSEKIQILTMVPDKCSRTYCSEYFNVFEYLVSNSHKVNKVNGILAKTKKRKTFTTETIYLVTNFYEVTISVGRCLKRKTMLVWVKRHIIKNFATCKTFCNSQELYTAFKEKHPNVNIGLSTFCAMRPKYGVLWLAQRWLTVFALVALIKVLWMLVHALNWELTCKDLIKKIVCNGESNKCIMHQCKSSPGTATLNEFLDQELNEHEDDEKFNYFQWDTTDRAILTTFKAITNNTKRLWLMLLMI